MLKYYLCRYKTYKMFNETVDDSLSALKFVPDWFVTKKMIKKLHEALFAIDDILLFHEDFGKVKWVFLL